MRVDLHDKKQGFTYVKSGSRRHEFVSLVGEGEGLEKEKKIVRDILNGLRHTLSPKIGLRDGKHLSFTRTCLNQFVEGHAIPNFPNRIAHKK